MENDEIIGSDSFAAKNEPVIGNNNNGFGNGEETIGAETQRQASGAEPNNSGKPNNDGFGTDLSADDYIAHSTSNGGLKSIPDAYNKRKIAHKEMLWEHLRVKSNPFKILFLDYKQYKSISYELIENNYKILKSHWASVVNMLDGVNRIRVKERYGDDFVPEIEKAAKTLETAFNQIKTTEGAAKWFADINKQRYNQGIATIEDFFKYSTKRGVLYKDDALDLVERGSKNNLTEEEVRGYIYNQLVAGGFSPRSETISTDFFDNNWMTDQAWAEKQARPSVDIEVMGRRAKSVKQLGEILFEMPERAKREYIAGSAYLTSAINLLEASDTKARQYEELINGERDIEKRYLKIIYKLNPSLPFRISNKAYQGMKDIMAETKQSVETFLAAAECYKNSQFHIWLQATNPLYAAKLTEKYDQVSFIDFLLKIDSSHPVLLHGQLFHSPQQLIDLAKSDKALRYKIIEAVYSGLIPRWFTIIGKQQWLTEYNEKTEAILTSGYHNDEDKRKACVQVLIQVIDKSIPNPLITADTNNIEALDIDAAKRTQYKIGLTLNNTGFVKAQLSFSTPVPGISLPVSQFEFDSLNQATRNEVTVMVDPYLLAKDKVYEGGISVTTLYNTFVIPFKVKAVFPKKAFMLYMLKYGGMGVVFFIVARGLLDLFTNGWRVYSPYTPTFRGAFNNMASNYHAFVITLLIMIVGIIGAYRLTKKAENL